MNQQPGASVRHLVHFAEDSDTSGFFPALAKYHDRKRYRMTFATLKPLDPQLANVMLEHKVATYSLKARSRLFYPVAIARLAQTLRQHRCDVLHAHLFDSSVVGLAAARLAGVPARILTRHYSNYHTRLNRPFHVKLDKLCMALSHQVIAVSNDTAEHLICAEGARAEKVTAIHNGIDFNRVKASGPDARLRVRRGLDLGDTFTFLIAARLHPEKGYEYLFESVRLLKTRCERPFLLLVAGRGPFLEKYQDLVRSLDIADRVRFLGFRNDLPDLMVASDVFVLSSVAEAFGLVLAEALYLGLPVLATRVGGIPEIVDDGLDGCLVPPADSAALSNAMGAFLRGTIQLPGKGEAAVRKVQERFAFETMLRGYEAVYERVLGAAH